MNTPKIVVVGSTNTDMTIHLDQLPRPGETLLGDSFAMTSGGKGANQAVAAARAGGSVSFVARTGQDAFGKHTLELLSQDGIDIRHVTEDQSLPSGVALIFVAANGDNCIAVASGANSCLSHQDLHEAGETIRRSDVLLTQLETPLDTVAAAIRSASDAGACVILNPAPPMQLPDELLRQISIITPNEHEASWLSQVKVQDLTTAEAAADRLLEKGVHTVVITLSDKGALVADSELRAHIPSFPVDAVDTVAAGDVFNGALAVAVGKGLSICDGVRFANAAAALSVTRTGAQPSIPRLSEIQAFLRAHA